MRELFDQHGRSSVVALVWLALGVGACNWVAGLDAPVDGEGGASSTSSTTADSTTGSDSSSSGGCAPDEHAGPGPEQLMNGSFESGSVVPFTVKPALEPYQVLDAGGLCGCSVLVVRRPAQESQADVRSPLLGLPPGNYAVHARVRATTNRAVTLTPRVGPGFGAIVEVPFDTANDDGSWTARAPFSVSGAGMMEVYVAVEVGSPTGITPGDEVQIDCISLTKEP